MPERCQCWIKHFPPDGEAIVQCQLCKAAPDLLEAAQGLVLHLSIIEEGQWLNNRCGQELIAAISKTTS